MSSAHRAKKDVGETTFNQVVGDHIEALHAIASRLEYWAYSLAAVGMDKVADDIGRAADALPPLCAELRAAYQDDLNGKVQNAQEHTALLLKATLAGCFGPPKSAA